MTQQAIPYEDIYLTPQIQLREFFLREQYIPANSLGIVYKGTQFERFIEPRKHNRRARFWSENFMGSISLLKRKFSFSVDAVNPENGFNFHIIGKAQFYYDPRQAKDPRLQEEYIHKDLNDFFAINNLVKDHISYHIRDFAAKCSAEKLLRGDVVVALRNRVEARLRRDLEEYGILLARSIGFIIEEVIPPDHFTYSREQGHGRVLEMTEERSLLEEEFQRHLMYQLAKTGGLKLFMGNQDLARMDQFFSHLSGKYDSQYDSSGQADSYYAPHSNNVAAD